MEFNQAATSTVVQTVLGTPKSTSSDYQLDPDGVWTATQWLSMAIDRSRVTLRGGLQSTQVAEEKLPRLDAMRCRLVCGHSGPELMTHHAIASLGTCNALIPVGHTRMSQKLVSMENIYMKKTKKT